MSEREFSSLQNGEKQHPVQTAEGEGDKSQVVSSLLKHPGEPEACISVKLWKAIQALSFLDPMTEYNRIHIEKLQ